METLKISKLKERQLVTEAQALQILGEEAFRRGAGWGQVEGVKVYCHLGSHREGSGWQIHSFGGLR